MLSLQLTEKTYSRTFSLRNIQLNVEKGCMLLLLGHNGAGKTTMIQSMFGLTPFKGVVSLHGKQLNFQSSAHISFLKEHVSYIPDDHALFDYLTPREYFHLLQLPDKLNGPREETFIDLFELRPYMDQPIAQLSHGNQKKTQIISQLLRPCDYYVFDEPTNGLDPDMMIILKKVLMKLRDQGAGILISTHHLSFGETLYDHLMILRNGDIKLDMSRQETNKTFPHQALEDIYKEVNQDYYMQVERLLNDLDTTRSS
ncbi:ATP-binding cassette domain-containing protein [Bacillus altitudinis]|uniref:ATP-binding cassette domain-containing protein n=1 Tax=Bacillus altitudinis TaxID=293387 RepID=UPI00234A8153|nr:ABC transporter ATP-binding protein [Bacillus altitudinis]MCA0923416.1 ABC transporter ATP-binding protein [Bacillus stratosphericus]